MMMMMIEGEACQEESVQTLLVEGKDDCHVVMALAGAQGLSRNFAIYSCGNDVQALRRLNALVLSPKRQDAVGLIVDADAEGPGARWDAVRAKVSRHGYKLPESLPREGAVVEHEARGPRIGVWVMPDNVAVGSLEDFCLSFIEKEDRDVVEEAVLMAEEKGVAHFPKQRRSKAVVHTYLAWQDEPGKPLGLAISSGLLQSASGGAEAFVEWLKRLFSA